MSDVFISYGRDDEEWVEVELRRRLEEAGLEVWKRKRRGQGIERPMVEAKKIAVVLTPEYVAAGWPARLEQIVSEDPQKVVPLLRRPCELPPFLSQLTALDFTGAVDELAWGRLLAAMGKTERLPLALGNDQPFFGRVRELRELQDWLHAGREPLMIVQGVEGVGKTTLLQEWLKDQSRRSFAWSFDHGQTFDEFLAAAASSFEISVSQPHVQIDSVIEVARAKGVLLAIDGYEPQPLGDIFLARLARSQTAPRAVVTTRAALSVPGARTLALTPLSLDESRELLRAHHVPAWPAESLERISNQVGRLPLSLRLIADLTHAERITALANVIASACSSLTPEQKRLLETIACVRGAVSSRELSELKVPIPYLAPLLRRGFVTRDPSTNTWSMHPAIRRHLSESLPNERRRKLHERLARYYAPPAWVLEAETLDDLRPLIAHYFHTLMSGRYADAVKFFLNQLAEPLARLFAHTLTVELLSPLYPLEGDVRRGMPEEVPLLILARACLRSGRPRDARAVLERYVTNIADAVHLRFLLGTTQFATGAFRAAQRNLESTLKLAKKSGAGILEFDSRRALARLHASRGRSHEADSEADKAAAPRDLREALRNSRTSGDLQAEASILVELARAENSREHAEEALFIAETCGYVMPAADAHLILARLAETDDERREHVKRAREYAICDGGEYTYAAAMAEAEALSPAGTAKGEIPLEQIPNILANIVLTDRGRLTLLEQPSSAGVLDYLRSHKRDDAAGVAELASRDAGFEPDPLWLAWVTHIHHDRLVEIQAQLLELAAPPAPE